MLVLGHCFRIARIVCAKCSAPPSARSSRSTEVTTTWARPSLKVASAMCSGSSGSTSAGDSTAIDGSDTSAAGALSSQVQAIVGKVTPGIVDINTVLAYQGGSAAGTGMVLTSSGEILTNNHVVDGATKITVTVVKTGATYSATVVGTDPTDDVAVIQLSGASGLQTAFGLYASTYRPHLAAAGAEGLNPLVAGFGPAMLDRAVLDALCRALDLSFYDAVRANLPGITAALTDRLTVDGFLTAVLGGLILAVVGWVADQVLDR